MVEIQKKLSLVNRTITTNRKKQWIVIHYVGAVSTAKNNVDYFYNVDRGASAHYFVDEKEIWQCVDDSNISWHCGAKKYYNDCRNQNSIGIEMCCKKDSKGNLYIPDKVIENTIELTKMLMEKFGIDKNHVCRHYDVTKKNCPAPLVKDEELWTNFKNKLEKSKEITDIKTALDFLEKNGRVTNRLYWEKALVTTRNVDYMFIKWANDLQNLLA